LPEQPCSLFQKTGIAVNKGEQKWKQFIVALLDVYSVYKSEGFD